MQERDAEVLIVGAGPTGLQLAHLLAMHHISLHIIDKKEGPSPTSSGVVIQARTREAWQNVRLGKEVAERAHLIRKGTIYYKKRPIGDIDFNPVETAYNFLTVFPEADTEAMLTTSLEKKERYVQWKTEFLRLSPIPHGAAVSLRTPEGEIVEKKYSWVIGCDGKESAVRDQVGIDCGTSEAGTVIGMCDVTLKTDLPDDAVVPHITGHGFFGAIPLGGNRYRLTADALSGPELSEEGWKALVEDRAPVPMQIEEIHWSKTLPVPYRVAKTLQDARVLLAGPAAHVLSPLFGHSFNAGLQDAYNLGWKLALKVQGRAHAKLIQSYSWERKKVADEILFFTLRRKRLFQKVTTFKTWLTTLFRVQTFASDNECEALSRRMLGLGVDYAGSPICFETISWSLSRARRIFFNGPRPGTRAPDAPALLKGAETTLYHYLEGYQHTILFFVRDERDATDSIRTKLISTAAKIQRKLPHEMRLCLVARHDTHPYLARWEHDVLLDPTYALHKAYAASLPSVYIIRPDNVIGYRASKIRDYLLKRYLSRIFDLT